MPVYEIPFLPGDGTDEVMLKVRYITYGGIMVGDGPFGCCAFCQGVIPGEAKPGSLIYEYFKRNPTHSCCPACKGQPT